MSDSGTKPTLVEKRIRYIERMRELKPETVGVETAELTTAMNTNETKTSKSYDTIKLGIDAHSKWYDVARQLDGATTQPVQKMELDEIMTKLK